MLGRHPDVYTVSETWLMLHPVYALRCEGYQAEYNEDTARRALRTFLNALPAGEEEYIEGARRMYGYLYRRLLSDRHECYVVDKTPRYYLIIRDLRRIFPEAKFIFLLRNPLAVLCSIVRTWVNDNWFRLGDMRLDLIGAPELLVEGIQSAASDCSVVRYEDLVTCPDRVVENVCAFLGIRHVAAMVDYGLGELDHWQLGDQDDVYRHERPVARNADRWLQDISDCQVWRLASEYLCLLGGATIEEMGYSYRGLARDLETRQPPRNHFRPTFSLEYLLRKPSECRTTRERAVVRAASLLRSGRMADLCRYVLWRTGLALWDAA
jgi:hypothetical protein